MHWNYVIMDLIFNFGKFIEFYGNTFTFISIDNLRFFGIIIGNNGAKLIASLCVILTTMFALVLVFEVAFNNIAVDINLSRWLDSDFFNIL